jgi:hypothetical protein
VKKTMNDPIFAKIEPHRSALSLHGAGPKDGSDDETQSLADLTSTKPTTKAGRSALDQYLSEIASRFPGDFEYSEQAGTKWFSRCLLSASRRAEFAAMKGEGHGK